MSTSIELLKQRYESLKSTRGNWEAHWDEIAAVVSPRKIGFTGMRSAGEKKMQQVYDSTGIHANELLAAGLHGLATNPASKWFSLRLTEDDLNEAEMTRQYLSDVEKRMFADLYQPGTNFTTALHECYLDLGAFGTAIIFVGQRQDGALFFECRSLSECLIDENSDGQVDTVFRSTEYTVRQMMQMWGNKCSDKVKEAFGANKLDTKVRVIHGVYPRKDRDTKKKDRANMPFASCYFELDTMHELETGGFPEFPYLVPRWSKYSCEIYGRSPGMTALPDIKMLQAITLTNIKALQKNADPPLFIPDDGVVGPVRTVPGGINFYRGQREIFPFPTSIQGLQASFEFVQSLQSRIQTTFFADVLQIVTDQEMTATEVMQRTTERMRLMGPLIGRLEAELLGPLVDRVFGIMNRLGKLPQPPPELADREFTVEYVSPIAMAQKQNQVTGLVQVAQTLMAMLGEEGAVMTLAKRVSPNQLVDWLWDLYNNDPDLLNTPEQQATIESQQQAQQGAATAVPMADAAQKGAGAVKSLADAQAGGGIDLQALLGKAAQGIQDSPQAQQELAGAMNGTRPN